jgi:serine/threonine-protein kinase
MPESTPPPDSFLENPRSPLTEAGRPVFGADTRLATPPAPPVEPHTTSFTLRERPGQQTTPPLNESKPVGVAGRILLFGEIARGGMGAVFRGRDPQLGRELAVKVLREEHRDKPDLVERFLGEAQIGGQLQHPGVVPIYELGQFDDERPFFTMKLVKGQTLAELLAQRSSPAEDLPRFLTIFEQVCQTMAYAHSRGVVHRDLKPANIMVGSFGEVQVMDWGLAKLLPPGDGEKEALRPEGPLPDDAPTLIFKPRSNAGSDESQPGAVLGTPMFMPPEQARGQVDKIDERADVFGLGGVLCAILTGQPPYSGLGDEVYRQAVAGDLEGAWSRLDHCGADAELIRLCKACLAKERNERPRHAGEVAQLLGAYQSGVQQRLRQAELERAAAQARAAEEHKRRKLTAGLAAALLALVVGGSIAGLYLQRQAEQQRIDNALQAAEHRRDVETALKEAASLREKSSWSEARILLEQTRRQLGDLVPPELSQQLDQAIQNVDQAIRDRDLVEKLNNIRQKRSIVVEGKFDIPTALQDYTAKFQEVGLGPLGADPEAIAEKIRSSAIKEQLVAALDDWASIASEEDRKWLLEVARRADPDPWKDKFRDPAARQDRKALELLAREAKVDELSPQALAALANALRSCKADPVPLLKAAWHRYPNDFWLNFELGTALLHAKKLDEAVSHFLAAVALQPDSVAAHNNLGNALDGKGLRREAIHEYRAALKLDPKYAAAHFNLGLALGLQGQPDEAIDEFRRALELDPHFAPAHYNLGVALREKHQRKEAIEEYRAALQIDPTYSKARNNLAVALREEGLLDEAIQEYHTALKINPKDAAAHNNLGLALRDKHQLDDAIKEFQAALALDPKYAAAHYNLGLSWGDKHQPDEAIKEYRLALEIDPKHAPAHNNLGVALRDKGKLDEAIKEYRAALAIDSQYAKAHNNLGVALRDKKQLEEAIKEYRLALEIEPRFAAAHNNLGLALQEKNLLDDAIKEYRLALEIEPRYAAAYYNMGLALRLKNQPNEAIVAYREAIRIDPKYFSAHLNLGNVLTSQGKLAEATQEYRIALDLDPRSANTYGALGQVLLVQGHFEEARSYTQRCLDLLPEGAPLRPFVQQQLQTCERCLELDQKLTAYLEGKEQPADNTERLNLARFALDQKKLPVAAVRLYEDAFAADPKLEAQTTNSPRYNAACAAARAGCGQGKDAAQLADQQRAELRGKALAWLRKDLEFWREKADGDDVRLRATVQPMLKHWQNNAALVRLRSPEALAKLPEVEREEWSKFWDEVTALLKKVSTDMATEKENGR